MAVPTIYAKLIEEYDRQRQSEDPYIPEDLSSLLTKKFRSMYFLSIQSMESILCPHFKRHLDLLLAVCPKIFDLIKKVEKWGYPCLMDPFLV